MTGFDLDLFCRLKRRRTIASENSQPYRITRQPLALVRSEPDNR